jgi:hypothetical protein
MAEATFNFTHEKISVEDLADGRHVVKTTPGGAKILAYVSDGKATRYEAEDPTGKRQQLLVVKPDSADVEVSPDGSCMVCTFDGTFAGAVVCYSLIECPPDTGPEVEGPHV